MSELTLSGVCFRYPNAEDDTLQDINLRIDDGERHALLGASGAGKSTLLNVLAGLQTPTAGSVMLAGADVTQLPPAERDVALVFQFPVLYPGLNTFENLALPIRNKGWDKTSVSARVEQIVSLLQLEVALDSPVDRLSLAEKQLVAVGRALVRPDVRLLLLDEPLTAVATEAKWRLREQLMRLQEETGLTTVYVTHDQTEALTFAERVSVLSEGRILQTDTPVALCESPAHEFVGHFVGAPGMSFLAAERSADQLSVNGLTMRFHADENSPVQADDAEYTLGVRPEWVALGPDGLPAEVAGVRLLGVDSALGGDRTVLTLVSQGSTFKAFAGALQPGVQTHVRFSRAVVFQRQRRVGVASPAA